MPNIKSAKKKMKQDVKRAIRNKAYENAIDDVMKKATKAKKSVKNAALVSKAYSIIDKAAKKNIIHDNKANRLKKGVSKLIAAK